MRWLKFLIALMVLGAAAAMALYYWASMQQPRLAHEAIIEIPRGSSTRAIAEQLAKAGVIQSPWQFLAARLYRPGQKLQAGEYRFADPASALDVYGRIARGDIFYWELAIPEGQNIFDIATTVEQSGLMSGSDFLAAARDPALIRDLDPKAPTLEGYLFPDTYRVTRRTTAHELCRTLTARFRSEWKQLAGSAAPHDAVTLASLIEKEAAVPADRPLISSVFHNRLKLGMKLDCDPSTVYAALLEGRYRGVIHRSDLASLNAYNTYQHEGLPPGPIANPGKASLKAALEPATTDYLFFVALGDGSGRHQFSKDIKSHNLAAERYRRAVAK